ncbi:carbohydrate kinase FGGY [Xylanimonas cellulosilytica DSM 15894]|uniref:Carbohydrate kinase FGGY n=1 Tax=Xylanimonas cellulosilytica (strain DSM 15894 / JCM 12276 / CECT 5975 / KCTC 9989 / LMG 20990 / NBRC 107835 / XIL07) TaxID=446471 RepID=D1BXA1_XYLCX|nr:rhamnulokinase family protein [Xylanimonas cellulosilytica]ACZ31669.1 carbohydrate kinase FGGY [Xylanimonas cellulosilytica DSM 15894]
MRTSPGTGPAAFAAVDLGATSGRVMLGLLHDGARVELVETGRFANGPIPVPTPDGADLHWDVLHLWRGILDGLREAGRVAAAHGASLAGIGVDSWAVDYGLLDARGALVASPRCYRDPAFLPVADEVYARVPAAELYAVNGLQHLPFTTAFQLVDDAARPAFEGAHDLLLIPDLITCWLTGVRVAEVTNASTTGLVDAATRTWAEPLIDRLGREFPGLAGLRGLLPDLVEAGTIIGPLSATAQKLTGLGAIPVVAVASHDTASAVVGTPLPPPTPVVEPVETTPTSNPTPVVEPVETTPQRDEPVASTGSTTAGGVVSTGSTTVGGVVSTGSTTAEASTGSTTGAAAYISSGTWSLVGLELDAPVLTEASREAGFTNELGLDGTVRYLHNVMGLWVFDECLREWARSGDAEDLDELLDAAAAEPGGLTVVDLDDPAFLAPGDMPRRFTAAAERAGQPVPATRPALTRAVLDSLAAAYARTIRAAAELAGVRITQVHVVGGGSQNALLCRLTADATGLPVVAGPVEAAALGNVLVQARAVGVLVDDPSSGSGAAGAPRGLGGLRDVVAASSDLVRYEPTH